MSPNLFHEAEAVYILILDAVLYAQVEHSFILRRERFYLLISIFLCISGFKSFA